jgi:hypothetical protein
MARSRLAGWIFIVALTCGMPLSAPAQETTEPDKKQQEAIQKIQRLLDDAIVETKPFQEAMPLSQFLTQLEKQLPADRQVKLRIDREPLGDKFKEIAATPIELPSSPKRMSLRRALELALTKIKTKTDYRIGNGEVAITTPDRALYTAGYDIRNLVEKPIPLAISGAGRTAFTEQGQLRTRGPVDKAEAIVERLFLSLDGGVDRDAVQVLNANRLVIHASAARHAEIAEVLRQLRDFCAMDVSVKAELYEVDEAFYKKLEAAKRGKRIGLEEMERRELEKPTRGETLYTLLKKQKLILAGEEIRIDNGAEAELLSRYRFVRCLASPDQVRRGEKGQQLAREGVSFTAGIQISSDRRYVHLKLTEKAVELRDILRVQQTDFTTDKKTDADTPFELNTTQTELLDIPDGGTILTPVQFRPRALRDKNRWLVLLISPRINIEAEERIIRKGELESRLPELVADVLRNPRLQGTRDLYGTPGDKRFALIDSEACTWPKEKPIAVTGYQLTPAKREGKRLLGIRIDKYRSEEPDAITITLVNAGGNENGAVVGGCTLRYSVRSKGKGYVAELSEPPGP